MSVAGCLGPTERQMHLSADRRRVHVKNSRVHFIHCLESTIDVLRINRSRQHITHAIADLDCVFERVRRKHRSYWSKHLFLTNAHVRRYIGKYGGLDKESVCVIAARKSFTATSQRRAILMLTDTDVFHDLPHCISIDDRSDICLRVSAISNTERL